jgi:hypothetical protein
MSPVNHIAHIARLGDVVDAPAVNVRNACREGHHWKYGDDSWICQQGGAGNNWALGYYGYGPKVKAAALELVRREVEHCDSLQVIAR